MEEVARKLARDIKAGKENALRKQQKNEASILRKSNDLIG